MKNSLPFKRLATAISAAGLFCVSLSLPQPARASISCETGTATSFSNGSLASCVLRTDTNAALNNNTYPCKREQYISFDEQGRFRSCTLYSSIEIRRGNEVVKCLADHRVSVAISSDGNQSVSCQ